MLYGKCKKVLEAICFLSAEDRKTSTLDIKMYMNNKIHDEDLRGCIRVLEQEGYIKVLESTPAYLRVAPEHKGFHYKEYKHSEMKEFFLKSVFTPIVVSVITSLITLYLTGALRG